MSSIACGASLAVNSAAPTATPRLVGQFWGLDSDRVFSRRSASSTCFPALTRRAIAWPIDPAPLTAMTGLTISSLVEFFSDARRRMRGLPVSSCVDSPERRAALPQIARVEFDAGGGHVFLETIGLRRPRNRHNPR